MDQCRKFNPDEVFKKFKLIVFPTTFVGLSSALSQDIDYDLATCVYLKTRYNRRLMNFSEARTISPDHRAFEITSTDSRTLLIQFMPTNECIARARRNLNLDNRFMIDLRLMRANGLVPCCTNENHSEVARYYICGEYDFPKFTCIPNVLDFGNVVMKTTARRTFEMRNDSSTLAAKVQYCKEVGFRVHPSQCLIKPNAYVIIKVSVSPTTLKKTCCVKFKVINPHDNFEKSQSEVVSSICFNNALKLPIKIELNVSYNKPPRLCPIESLHKLYWTNPLFTYTASELVIKQDYNEISKRHMDYAKKTGLKITANDRLLKNNEHCVNIEGSDQYKNMCIFSKQHVITPEFIGINVSPLEVDFKSVALNTEKMEHIVIANSSMHAIKLLFSSCDTNEIRFTKNKLDVVQIKVPAQDSVKLVLLYTNNEIGSASGYFQYKINDVFKFNYPFKAEVENPQLYLKDYNLKFGMVTNEFFITSVPIRIVNKYNIDIRFEWDEISPDTPFEVITKKGFVSSNSFLMCDIVYTGAVTKTKIHTLRILSCGNSIEVELVIYTRKVSIKFLEPLITFGDMSLNLETTTIVTLENSSKEMALFSVLEPLITGLTVTPMAGIIRPKALLPFTITVKISAIIEFTFDVLLKINNKEVILLPLSGNILEPKVVIQPKVLNIPRIPYGLITHVPLVIQNTGSLRSLIEMTKDQNNNEYNLDFEICVVRGTEMKNIQELYIDAGQVITVYLRLYDTDRRAYDIFLPIKLNNLIGPPDPNVRSSNDLQYFINEYEKFYINNSKIKVKSINREVSFCKVTGVFCNKFLQFSMDTFELNYEQDATNNLIFSISNVSKSIIPVTILLTKIKTYFTLEVVSEDIECRQSDNLITFDLDPEFEIKFAVYFHPPKMGRFVAVADLYIDKTMSIAYHNLKFIGNYVNSIIAPSVCCLYFAPVLIGSSVKKCFTIQSQDKLEATDFHYKLEPTDDCIEILFSNCDETIANNVIEVEVKVVGYEESCQVYELCIYTSKGSECKLPISYCITNCPLTVHTYYQIKAAENPYPFYPECKQSYFENYMDTSVKFLEKWMYQQGFRRELFPVIPDTFHVISSSLFGHSAGSINISILNFLRRIAGPLAKHLNKTSFTAEIESKEAKVRHVHDVYNEIIILIKKHGGLLGMIQAKYLLSYQDFLIFMENDKYQQTLAEYYFDRKLIKNEELFKNLNKQSWFDLILQCYKAFVFDSCLRDCQLEDETFHNNNTEILLRWLNKFIDTELSTLFVDYFDCVSKKTSCDYSSINNFTTDLSSGIAFAAATVHFCPFLKDHLTGLSKISSENEKADIIHNALLLIECWNQLKLYFPIESQDFLSPNYLQMIFLTVHLNVILPMLKPRDELEFHPSLLGNSSRNISLSTGVQESVVCTHTILNNHKNNFTAEKDTNTENGKRTRINVKYTANFTSIQSSVLLLVCHNKTRTFDTFVVFLLKGYLGSIEPFRKYKINCPLYKAFKSDIMINSPFTMDSQYRMILTEEEPQLPIAFKNIERPQFLVRRVNIVDENMFLIGSPNEPGTDVIEQRFIISLFCTSTECSNAWVWFCGEEGEFYIRITTLPRTDSPQDSLQAKIGSWPIEKCSCGEECECYRTAVLTVPFRNGHMLHTLRSALLENASPTMMEVYDQYIETTTGRLLVSKLLEEHGTNMIEVSHILRDEVKYIITSRHLQLMENRVTMRQYMEGELPLTVCVPVSEDPPDKFTLTFTSECGTDVRTYRVLFRQDDRMSV